ncbi:unnamed protein product, partial [Anisakis simplex]|uniref:DUF320 domain-containing protein n=1 Tax=Anisakis simplex TaxID=6269 RepID=A0A0M3KIW6_ANISI
MLTCSDVISGFVSTIAGDVNGVSLGTVPSE